MQDREYWDPSTSDYFFSFDGRIGRFEFFLLSVTIPFAVGLLGAIAFVIIRFFLGDGGVFLGDLYTEIYLLCLLIVIWPSLALTVKRCHDRNRNGIFVLVGLIPIINIWYLIEMVFLKGVETGNRFGPPSHESTLIIFHSSCSECGTKFGYLDLVTQPFMCAKCWRKHKSA
jgi:uncharacterized membrane protein YhaH (DUF805 family)